MKKVHYKTFFGINFSCAIVNLQPFFVAGTDYHLTHSLQNVEDNNGINNN
ncbi:MAG: hypothetical protein H7336_06430 [Bacteriovorax sp.]|nr:hypothetical protein [Bacteriovorax sp.]